MAAQRVASAACTPHSSFRTTACALLVNAGYQADAYIGFTALLAAFHLSMLTSTELICIVLYR
jgi:hypothetical protein